VSDVSKALIMAMMGGQRRGCRVDREKERQKRVDCQGVFTSLHPQRAHRFGGVESVVSWRGIRTYNSEPP